MSTTSRPLPDFNYCSNSLEIMLNLLLLIIKLLYKTDKKKKKKADFSTEEIHFFVRKFFQLLNLIFSEIIRSTYFFS